MNAVTGPDKRCTCRLLVVGPRNEITAFDRQEEWPPEFMAVEPLELLPTRRSWQFETQKPPLAYLRALSTRWPLLTFFLDYDTGRIKGLASFTNGKVRHHRIAYPK